MDSAHRANGQRSEIQPVMIILPVFDTIFREYVQSLSETGRKNWNYVRKHNTDLGYQEIMFDKALIQRFMGMWEQQPIRGEKRQWAFGIDYVQELSLSGELRTFITYDNSSECVRGVHFVQMHDEGYVECHPPMWEKTPENEKRYLAKYMWFNLIKFAISDSDMRYLDFGGGRDDSWREMIKHRDEYPNPKYKWLYIPKDVKENPDKQPDYVLLGVGGRRRLEEI